MDHSNGSPNALVRRYHPVRSVDESSAANLTMRLSQLAQSGTLLLLLAMVLVLPFLYSPDRGAWRGARTIAFQMLALALLGLAAVQTEIPRSGRRIIERLREGPNLPILLLVVYGAVSGYGSSSPKFSGVEWRRLACGAGVYFVVDAVVRRREQVKGIVDALMSTAALTSLYGIITYSQKGAPELTSSFGNRQLFAGFLLLLTPLLVTLSFGQLAWKRKLAAQGAAGLSAIALMLAQNRTSWVGAAVALGVLGVMALCQRARGGGAALQSHQMVVPVVMLVGALGLFFVISGEAPAIRDRATTMASAARDPSVRWRLGMWWGAWKLVRERPLLGWGIGMFPLEQCGVVPDAMPRAIVQREGPTLHEEAHNEYLQIAAELGIVGLGLYVWILGAFFGAGIRALRTQESNFARLVVMGCVAGVSGQVIDALSNPAWRFADVSFLFWLMMGLGMAAGRMPRRLHAAGPAASARISRGWPRLGWQGAALGLTVLAMGQVWVASTHEVSAIPCPEIGEYTRDGGGEAAHPAKLSKRAVSRRREPVSTSDFLPYPVAR